MTTLTTHPNGSSTTASTHAGVTLGRIERIAGGVVVALVVLLGVIGAVNSFRAVAEAVEPSFGGLAWTVPLGVDVGIAVFTALDFSWRAWGCGCRGCASFPGPWWRPPST